MQPGGNAGDFRRGVGCAHVIAVESGSAITSGADQLRVAIAGNVGRADSRGVAGSTQAIAALLHDLRLD